MDRVLVTRPEPAAEKTAIKLKKLGFEPVLLPLFSTVFQPFPAELKAANFAAIAFTSRNGVAATPVDFIDDAVNKNLPVYVVGKATAETAYDAGFRRIRTGAGTGQDLARWIAEDNDTGRAQFSVVRPLLYLAGVERKPDFEAALAKSSIAVTTVEIYRMEIISYTTDFLNSDKLSLFPKFVLLYSANAARRFGELISAQPDVLPKFPVTTLCLSQEVAQVLPQELRTTAVVADAPNEAALLERLAGMR